MYAETLPWLTQGWQCLRTTQNQGGVGWLCEQSSSPTVQGSTMFLWGSESPYIQ